MTLNQVAGILSKWCLLPGWVVWAAAAGQALHARIKVGLKEEGDRVSVSCAVRDHPVHGGLEAPVGPPADTKTVTLVVELNRQLGGHTHAGVCMQLHGLVHAHDSACCRAIGTEMHLLYGIGEGQTAAADREH